MGIVERLRAIRGPRDMSPWPPHPGTPHPTLSEAADRIEALETQLKVNPCALTGQCTGDKMLRELADKAAEIERLRMIEAAALNIVHDDCDAVIHPNCWRRLKEALNETG